MTTGKQQMAEQSTSSDDLIAELSRLMAQDAHGSRRDAAPPPQDAPRLTTVATPPAETQAAPFPVRIPGASAPQPANAAPPPPRFDFGRAPAPVASVPRQEPAFAPMPIPEPKPATAAPVATNTQEAAPFSFDFDFGQQRQQTEPQAAPVAPTAAAPASQPAMAPVGADEHDTIADLIAAELAGGTVSPPTAAAAAPIVTPVDATPVSLAEPAAPASPVTQDEVLRPAAWAPKPVAVANLSDRPAQARPTLRPVNLTPVQKTEKPENDSFRVPPVFGLGTNPTAAAKAAPAVATPEPVAVPKARAEHGYLSPVPSEPTMAPPANDQLGELDPIDEIESLIGRAVRVDLDSAREPQAQPAERPVASPALRSLATPTAAPVSQPSRQPVSGVDEAILAAAAATGAEVGWVEPGDDHQVMTADEPRRARDRAPRRSGLLRVVAGPLVAVALLLAAGFGLYSVLGLGGSDGPAPVLVADASPTKSVPDVKGAVQQLQQSIVFNEMDGVVPGAEEQLVSRDQADVNEVTALPPAAAVTDEGLANRKVRTVTVRPDGTIVSGEDSVAGAAILPVDRPNVPAVPGAETASTELLASANAATPTPAAPAPVAAAPVAPLVPGTEIAVIDASGAPIAGKSAPVPYVRPASVGDAPPTGPVNAIVDAPQAGLAPLPSAAPAQNLTATTAPAQQAPVTTAAPTNAPAYAQLSSQRSPEVAQQVAKDLSAKYAPILNGAQLEITRADLGARGIYYRVRVPAASREYAAQFCATVTANGGDCVAM